MTSTDKKVLITGGLGSIGLQLGQELISQGYDVVLLDNLSPQVHGVISQIDSSTLNSSKTQVIRGDIKDTSLLESLLTQVSAIIHLAAETGTGQSMYQIAHYNEVNTQGTAILLDILANKKHFVNKVILASSRSIYGEGAYRNEQTGQVEYPEARSAEALSSQQWEPLSSSGRPLSVIATPENSPPHPASIYAATKYAQEDLVRIACSALNMPYTILRFQNVYGDGQSLNNPYTGILSIFSTRIRKGLALPIFEDGKESRDFVHVRDVARATKLSLGNDQAHNQVFNVGSGIPTSILEIARKLNAAFNGSSEIQATGQYRLGDIRHCYADLNRINQQLKYEPEVSLEQGLSEFSQWVLSQPLPEDGLEQANQELAARNLMGQINV
jgi:dTDP-L-rhamnose 4-epimerase